MLTFLFRCMRVRRRQNQRGACPFTLSETASDKEAAALAQNENKADLIGGPDLGVEDQGGKQVLRMFQRGSMNQSTHFAEENSAGNQRYAWR